MPTATMTSKGQITIPKEIRDALGLKTGDRVAFRLLEGGKVEMQPRTVDLRSLAGMIEPETRGKTLEDFEKAIAAGAVRSGLVGSER